MADLTMNTKRVGSSPTLWSNMPREKGVDDSQDPIPTPLHKEVPCNKVVLPDEEPDLVGPYPSIWNSYFHPFCFIIKFNNSNKKSHLELSIGCWALWMAVEKQGNIAVYLPLCAKVIASEKDTSANKVKCSIENAKVQTLECRGDLQVRKWLAL